MEIIRAKQSGKQAEERNIFLENIMTEYSYTRYSRSLNWLKAGNTVAVEQTLSHLQLQMKEAASTGSAKLSDLFRDKASIRGLIIILGLFIGQQFGGIFAMVIIDNYLQILHIKLLSLLKYYLYIKLLSQLNYYL